MNLISRIVGYVWSGYIDDNIRYVDIEDLAGG